MRFREVEWISQVRKFSNFMGSIPRDLRGKIAPVKIAIIDDGVDASLEFLLGKIAGGKSFCPYASSSDLMNAYYVPSGQHGTMMADLICKICPSCRLYVARLDERPGRSDSTRHITIDSAAEVCTYVHCAFQSLVGRRLNFQTLGGPMGRRLQSRYYFHELDHRSYLR